MPNVSEVPWLRPARTLQAIEAGASAGGRRAALETSAAESAARNAQAAHGQALQAQQAAARIAAEQQRTQSEMAQAKMRLDAQTKTQQEQSMKQAQQLKIDGARKDAEFGLRQQRLKQLGDQAQAVAAKAAREFAGRDKLARLVQGGMSPDKAIFQVPELMTGGAINSAISASHKPVPKIPAAQQFADSPVMQGEEQDTEEQIRSGVPELKAIQDHPTLLQNPPYAQRWGPRFNAAKSRDEAAKAKADKPPKEAAASTLANRRESLVKHLDEKDLPVHVKKAYKKEIFQIDTELNGGKPPEPTAEDIQHLKDTPDAKDKFDSIFGDGAADKVLK